MISIVTTVLAVTISQLSISCSEKDRQRGNSGDSNSLPKEDYAKPEVQADADVSVKVDAMEKNIDDRVAIMRELEQRLRRERDELMASKKRLRDHASLLRETVAKSKYRESTGAMTPEEKLSSSKNMIDLTERGKELRAITESLSAKHLETTRTLKEYENKAAEATR